MVVQILAKEPASSREIGERTAIDTLYTMRQERYNILLTTCTACTYTHSPHNEAWLYTVVHIKVRQVCYNITVIYCTV